MIKEFQNYLSAVKGYSDNTVVAYGKDLKDFVHYMLTIKEAPTWSTVIAEEVQGYVVDMHDRQLNNTTIKRRVSAIRSLFNYMKVEGLLQQNPARFTQTPKCLKKLPNVIDINSIVDAVTSESNPLKVRCMLALLLETGVRLQELLDLRTEHFNGKEHSIRILGKGGKERMVYYGDLTKELLNRYVGHRQGRIFWEEQRDARRLVFETLRKYSNARQLSPHAIRHTFATCMLNNGADIKAIQDLLGHESVKTTERYAQLTQQATREQYNMFYPRV